MKPAMLVGLILSILGVVLLFWQGVVFFTTREPTNGGVNTGLSSSTSGERSGTDDGSASCAARQIAISLLRVFKAVTSSCMRS